MQTTIRKKIGLLLLAAAFSSCAKSNNAPAGSEKGYITGKVTDMLGNPIAGAKILLDDAVYCASYLTGTSKEDGTYKIKIDPGSWKAQATLKKEYNGQSYTLQLHPDKTDFFTEEGAVRNFTWKLEGRMPWEAEDYYGCTVILSSYIDENIEDIEFTFTPVGALIDGSAGRTLTIRYGDDQWQYRYELRDIPLGRYKVTASLLKNGTKVPLKIDDWYHQGSLQAEFVLDFIPDPPNAVANSASIIIDD